MLREGGQTYCALQDEHSELQYPTSAHSAPHAHDNKDFDRPHPPEKLEEARRTSSSDLAEKGHDRSAPLEPWSERGLEKGSEQRPMVAGLRNGYAQLRGMPLMMILIQFISYFILVSNKVSLNKVSSLVLKQRPCDMTTKGGNNERSRPKADSQQVTKHPVLRRDHWRRKPDKSVDAANLQCKPKWITFYKIAKNYNLCDLKQSPIPNSSTLSQTHTWSVRHQERKMIIVEHITKCKPEEHQQNMAPEIGHDYYANAKQHEYIRETEQKTQNT